jgi:hypothetical protein
MYKIYHLSEKSTGKIFYVGRTKIPLKERLSCHISLSKTKVSAKGKKIQSILKRKGEVLITEICRTDDYSTSFILENFWFNKLQDAGCKMLNINTLCGVPEKAPKKVFLKCG